MQRHLRATLGRRFIEMVAACLDGPDVRLPRRLTRIRPVGIEPALDVLDQMLYEPT